jgi:hypothetical protein
MRALEADNQADCAHLAIRPPARAWAALRVYRSAERSRPERFAAKYRSFRAGFHACVFRRHFTRRRRSPSVVSRSVGRIQRCPQAMTSVDIARPAGFDFGNASRNAHIASSSAGRSTKLPKATSTGDASRSLTGAESIAEPHTPALQGLRL